MPLQIVIDGRHIRDFGIGTYIRNAVRALARIDREDDFFVVVGPSDVGELANLPANFRVVPYSTPNNSLMRFLGVPGFLRPVSSECVPHPFERGSLRHAGSVRRDRARYEQLAVPAQG